MSTHVRVDGACSICEKPAGECIGNQCTASVRLLVGESLYCHDETHDGDRHHMQLVEWYDSNDPDVGSKFRASRMIDVYWQISDTTLGDILADANKKESET